MRRAAREDRGLLRESRGCKERLLKNDHVRGILEGVIRYSPRPEDTFEVIKRKLLSGCRAMQTGDQSLREFRCANCGVSVENHALPNEDPWRPGIEVIVDLASTAILLMPDPYEKMDQILHNGVASYVDRSRLSIASCTHFEAEIHTSAESTHPGCTICAKANVYVNRQKLEDAVSKIRALPGFTPAHEEQLNTVRINDLKVEKASKSGLPEGTVKICAEYKANKRNCGTHRFDNRKRPSKWNPAMGILLARVTLELLKHLEAAKHEALNKRQTNMIRELKSVMMAFRKNYVKELQSDAQGIPQGIPHIPQGDAGFAFAPFSDAYDEGAVPGDVPGAVPGPGPGPCPCRGRARAHAGQQLEDGHRVDRMIQTNNKKEHEHCVTCFFVFPPLDLERGRSLEAEAVHDGGGRGTVFRQVVEEVDHERRQVVVGARVGRKAGDRRGKVAVHVPRTTASAAHAGHRHS